MIRWVYRSLPGSRPMRIALFALLWIVFLVVLHFFYEWAGATFLDPGGGVG